MMVKRTFVPGTEWFYLKIYTGIKTADVILIDAVGPLIQYFQERNYISKWFFIRYNDPKPHLRVRLMLNNTDDNSKIFDKINDALQEYIESGEISHMVIDTYRREIERYGQNSIEKAETLFYKNSEFTQQCLQYDDDEKIIISLFYINEILDKLNLTIEKKLQWIKDFNYAFKQEFNANKKLNSQLDKKYREFKPKFLDFIQSEEFLGERNFITLNIEESNLTLQNLIKLDEDQSLKISLQSFFQSIFHMNINRLFLSNQRLFEMIIYDYMLRYYKTKFLWI